MTLKFITKKGAENIVADSLSRKPAAEGELLVISSITTDLLQEVQTSWNHDPIIQERLHKLQQQPLNPTTGQSLGHYSWFQHLLRRKGKPVVGNNSELRNK